MIHVADVELDIARGLYPTLSSDGFRKIAINGYGGLLTNLEPQAAGEINLSDEELSRTASFEADKEFDWGYRDDVIADLNFYRVPPY